LPVDPGWDRAPWACSPGFAPRQAGPARRTPGQGTGIKHSPGVIRPASAPDLLPLTHSQCATSCRTIGLDISREFPKPLATDKVQAADVVITMGCGDACPVYPGKRYLDWDLPDPADLDLGAVRPIRDEIRRRVTTLLNELA
jgi:Low molecular weight phosphotyrosine protein phosphatase